MAYEHIHYPVTGARKSILKMQILPSSLNISNAIYSKEIHLSTTLIKRWPINLRAVDGWGPLPLVPNSGSPRMQGSPEVHHPTYVIQSNSIFCAKSQDLYYGAGIELQLNRWQRLVKSVNFWPQFFSSMPAISRSSVPPHLGGWPDELSITPRYEKWFALSVCYHY